MTRCRTGSPAPSRARRGRADHQETRSQAQSRNHWSVRAIAKETGVTNCTVHPLFQLFGLQPHRSGASTFRPIRSLSRKLRDVVGLYLNPPDRL